MSALQSFIDSQDDWVKRKKAICATTHQIAYAEIAGSEPAIILIHGYTDSSRSFSLVSPYLRNRRLIIPDLRGHGDSSQADAYSLAELADDIVALIERLRLERPLLVGHSLGAMVAMDMCTRAPEKYSGLVIIAGSLLPHFEASHPLSIGVKNLHDPIAPNDPFFGYWHQCSREVPPAFLAGVARDASRMPADRWRRLFDVLKGIDLRNRAGALVRFPMMIISGLDDPLFGAEHQLALARAVPTAGRVGFAGCGHNPHWEVPQEVAGEILSMAPVH